jgi:Raf kinase inhibitor-like YbhB/YbcL family protein
MAMRVVLLTGKRILLIYLLAATAVFNGCSIKEPGLPKEGEMSLMISSPAFIEGGTIPQKYTCDGQNLSPQLNWSGIPQGTKNLALIVDDPDAPIGIFVHWVLFGMDGSLKGLSEGVPPNPSISGVGLQGINGFRNTRYDGPCPPRGGAHRYFFKLYALDTAITLKPGASKADLEKAMQGHILAQGQVMGRYSRK